MFIHARIVALMAASTILAGAAYAAEPTTAVPPTAPAAQTAVERDVNKLSVDGSAAFRNLHAARLAIFNAEPAQAKTLIDKAQAEIQKAKIDDTVFTKAEADLKAPTDKGGAATATTNNPDAAKPVAWVPVDGQLALSDDFVATPQKAMAVTAANKSLAKGDQKAALETLKLADVNVSFTMAVMPLASTTSDIDKAATLIADGKYYEANGIMKQAEDGIRFDVVDVSEAPKAQQAATTPKDAPAANTMSKDVPAAAAKTTK